MASTQELSDGSVGSASSASGDTALPSFVDFAPERYEALLAANAAAAHGMFVRAGLLAQDVECEVHDSAPRHYRQRVGFGLYDCQAPQQYRATLEGADDVKAAALRPLRYVYWDDGKIVELAHDVFPIASAKVCGIMPTLLREVAMVPQLRDGLRSAKFLSTMSSGSHSMLITLVYKQRKLGTSWQVAASTLKRALGCSGLIGRSKGVVRVLGDPYVVEEGIKLADGRALLYKQPEQAFSNPNGGMAIHTLNWLCSCAAQLRGAHGPGEPLHLLELYCGNGNHTVALAGVFERVVAVEINPKLVEAARENLAMNGVTNAHVLCVNAKYFSRNILGSRKWKQKTGEAEFELHAVLVDPPRSGLDTNTLYKVARFTHILYISCNPLVLLRDVQKLHETHTCERFAFFDHFPYTKHQECGVYLLMRPEVAAAPLPKRERQGCGRMAPTSARGLRKQRRAQERAQRERESQAAQAFTRGLTDVMAIRAAIEPATATTLRVQSGATLDAAQGSTDRVKFAGSVLALGCLCAIMLRRLMQL